MLGSGAGKGRQRRGCRIDGIVRPHRLISLSPRLIKSVLSSPPAPIRAAPPCERRCAGEARGAPHSGQEIDRIGRVAAGPKLAATTRHSRRPQPDHRRLTRARPQSWSPPLTLPHRRLSSSQTWTRHGRPIWPLIQGFLRQDVPRQRLSGPSPAIPYGHLPFTRVCNSDDDHNNNTRRHHHDSDYHSFLFPSIMATSRQYSCIFPLQRTFYRRTWSNDRPSRSNFSFFRCSYQEQGPPPNTRAKSRQPPSPYSPLSGCFSLARRRRQAS